MDDLLGRSVFVFTPAGQVMRLPRVSHLLLSFAPHMRPWFMGRSCSHVQLSALGTPLVPVAAVSTSCT